MKYAEMEEKMRQEKIKGKAASTETSSSNELDSTETVSESNQTESPPEKPHFEADGSQIDDEGQNHNIDDAVQYVDDTDTVDPPRPSIPTKPADTHPQTSQVVNHPVEYLSSTTEEVIAGEPNRIIVPDDEEDEERAGSHDDHREVDNRQIVNPTTNSQSTKAAVVGGQPLNRPPRPNRVQVESERVEVIEIKSDGSSGHLTHSEYH